MKRIVALIAALSLSGCGLSQTQTGKRVTSDVDENGQVIKQVSEDVPIDTSKMANYIDGVDHITTACANIAKSKAAAIVKMAQPVAGESETSAAWRAAMGYSAIRDIREDCIANGIMRLQYGEDWQSVIKYLGGKALDTTGIGLVTWGVKEIVQTGVQGAGNSTTIGVSGDGNHLKYSSKETTTITENHANTTGGYSPPNINTNPTTTSESPTTTTTEVVGE